jgi:hypothetical protein
LLTAVAVCALTWGWNLGFGVAGGIITAQLLHFGQARAGRPK